MKTYKHIYKYNIYILKDGQSPTGQKGYKPERNYISVFTFIQYYLLTSFSMFSVIKLQFYSGHLTLTILVLKLCYIY